VDPDKTSKLSFETALAKLESIVDSMEQGDTPLADLLGKYEEGSRLLKACETRLKEAELKIEQLKKSREGDATFEPFESSRGA
jgi:exodeoxyribonuclease VII small subunit